MCIIPVSKLHKFSNAYESFSHRRSYKFDSFKFKKFNNENQYELVTSPNRNIRVGITHDGEIDVWGHYVNIKGRNSFKTPAAICDPCKIFSSDRACAVITKRGDLWIWGLLPWNIDPYFVSVWFLEKQKFPINHIDFCRDHLLVTDSRGRVLAIDTENNHSKHAYLESFSDIKMTSTHYGHSTQNTIFLYKSGYVVNATSGCDIPCNVPSNINLVEVEAHHDISAGITENGEIKVWGKLDHKRDYSNWSLPWKVSDEEIMKFAMDYGTFFGMRRIPRRIKRKADFKSMRMMQKMAMH